MADNSVLIDYSDFKGSPMIVLRRNTEDRFPFQFGLQKGRLLVDGIDQIRAWVEREEAKKMVAEDAKIANS